MTEPFTVVQQGGVCWIDQCTDAKFRVMLLEVSPRQVHAKIRIALAATPDKNAAEHSKRYFGSELPALLSRANPLIVELDSFAERQLKLSGFSRWLQLTNYGNDYRMIKAMVAWADLTYAREEAERKAASLH